jgi:hypothetical protein
LSFRNIRTVKRCGKVIEMKPFINLLESSDAVVDYFSADQKVRTGDSSAAGASLAGNSSELSTG